MAVSSGRNAPRGVIEPRARVSALPQRSAISFRLSVSCLLKTLLIKAAPQEDSGSRELELQRPNDNGWLCGLQNVKTFRGTPQAGAPTPGHGGPGTERAISHPTRQTQVQAWGWRTVQLSVFPPRPFPFPRVDTQLYLLPLKQTFSLFKVVSAPEAPSSGSNDLVRLRGSLCVHPGRPALRGSKSRRGECIWCGKEEVSQGRKEKCIVSFKNKQAVCMSYGLQKIKKKKILWPS